MPIIDQSRRCSFCKKWQGQIKQLIAGPDCFICDECVDLCGEILKDAKKDAEESNNA